MGTLQIGGLDVEVRPSGYFWTPLQRGRKVKIGETRLDVERFARELAPVVRRDMLADTLDGRAKLAVRFVYSRAKARARMFGHAILTKDEFLILWHKANGKCQVSGIPFEMVNQRPGTKNPWAPSLDRKDSSRGYEVENCRVVCVAVNIALSDFGDAVLMRIAKAMAGVT